MGFTIKVQAIIPKQAWNSKAVIKELNAALEETGKALDKEFGKTVDKWAGAKPTFSHTTGGTGAEGGSVFVHSFPSGDQEGVEKWVRLDEGTEHNYPITPRRAKWMVFPWQGVKRSYNARTKPGYLGSDVGDGQKLGPTVFRKHVMHPGVDPREWSKTLGEQEIKAFVDRVVAAIQKGLGG